VAYRIAIGAEAVDQKPGRNHVVFNKQKLHKNPFALV
jgi:hypothetical protein